MPQQRPVTMGHQHNHRRIGAREMIHPAASAVHHMPGAGGLAHAAADAAEFMLCPPMHQPPRMSEHGGILPVQQPHGSPQIGKAGGLVRHQRCSIILGGNIHRKHWHPLAQAQKRPVIRPRQHGGGVRAVQKHRFRGTGFHPTQ